MDMLYLQVDIIAKGNEDIFNVLFFVVVFIVWLIRMIASAKSQQKKDASGEKPQIRPIRQKKEFRPAGGIKAASQRTFERPVEKFGLKEAVEKVLGVGAGRLTTMPLQTADRKEYAAVKPPASIDNKIIEPEKIIKSTIGEVVKQEEQVAKPILMADLVSRPISKEHLTSDSFTGIELPDGSLDKSVQAQGVLESLKEFDSPDTLRNAILYYEILGKPLSEREYFEHQIF